MPSEGHAAIPAVASAGTARPAVPSEIAGTYAFVGGDAELQQIKRVVEAAIVDLNFVIRAVARKRLENQVVPYASIAFQRAGEEMDCVVNGNTAVRTPLDGAPVSGISPTGDAMTMRQWFEGNNLVQAFEVEIGNRRNELVPSADGDQLCMKVEMTASILPKPVRYELTYRRVGAGVGSDVGPGAGAAPKG